MGNVKVLHLINTLHLGGAEFNLYNLIRAVDRDRFDIHVAYSFGGVVEERFKREKVKLFKYARSTHKVKSFASIPIILRLAGYIRRNGIRIVHTHNFNAQVWGSIAAKLSGAKVVEHVHDFRYEEPDYIDKRGVRSRQFKFAGIFAKLSDIIIVLTRNNRDFLLKHKICSEDKIRIMLNGIRLDRERTVDVPALREKLNIPEGKRVVLSAARISPEKNMGIVSGIASCLKEKHNDVFFVIAGDGPLKEELEEAVQEKGLDKWVRVIGFYPDVKELLGITSIFIQPTLLELHSITMLEAMSMRVPVLVSKGVGSNDDFITDKVDGFLLDPYDAKEWCGAIDRLLNDSALTRNVSDNARKTVENKCDITNTVKTLENIYSELAG